MDSQKNPARAPLSRAAEALFNFPRLYRAKFALTGAVLNVVRPYLFKTMVREEDLICAAAIPAGASVCEIGCGDGENYKKIARIVGNVRYTGIDINPAMIKQCKETFSEHQWLVAGLPYPFSDDSFDYCIIVNVLHHLNSEAEVASMLLEAKRISRNILLFEPLQSENFALYRIKRIYWALTDGGLRFLRLHEFRTLFESVGLKPRWERFTSPLRHFYGVHLIRTE
jgi:SAM-dependent methyltransferase